MQIFISENQLGMFVHVGIQVCGAKNHGTAVVTKPHIACTAIIIEALSKQNFVLFLVPASFRESSNPNFTIKRMYDSAREEFEQLEKLREVSGCYNSALKLDCSFSSETTVRGGFPSFNSL